MPSKGKSSRAVSRALRVEHGYIGRRVGQDPPPLVTTPEFVYKQRYTANLVVSGPLSVTIKTSTALAIPSTAYKVVKATAWGRFIDHLTLQVVEVRPGGNTSQVTDDFSGKNHWPACTVSPPQDDWFRSDTTATEYYNITVVSAGVGTELSAHVGTVLIDVVYRIRVNLPIITLTPALETHLVSVTFPGYEELREGRVIPGQQSGDVHVAGFYAGLTLPLPEEPAPLALTHFSHPHVEPVVVD